MTGSSPIITWVIDDNEEYLSVIDMGLNAYPEVACTKKFPRCEPAIDILSTAYPPPNVLLLDVSLPGLSGIDAIHHFKTVAPSLRIVMLTVSDKDETVLAALRAGASGYILKTSPVTDVVRAVEQAATGGLPIDPMVSRAIIQTIVTTNRRIPKDYQLTEREMEVLRMMATDGMYFEIAKRMCISIYTFQTHAQHILEKLGVNSRAQAVAKAFREGLILPSGPVRKNH